MLNKFFKTIHNKYLGFFKFIFFLRYLFAIFLISISIFLTIPIFFNYENRAQLIKDYLVKNYNFEISKYENIKFKAFPIPKLELKNVYIKHEKLQIDLSVKKLKIYPKIFNIYNFSNFDSNKIFLNDVNIKLKTNNLKGLADLLLNQKKKLSLNNLNIKILDENKLILNLENLYFSNFGYRKNLIEGKVFGKKFKTQLKNNLKFINFKLLNTGINSEISLDDKQSINKKSGVFKSKILNANLKFNFEYETEKLKIYNFLFRDKNLSFKSESSITFNPFLMNTNFTIEEFNSKIFKKIDFARIVELKDKLKKINGENIINFKSQKFSKSIINNLTLQINLAYGRVNYRKEFIFAYNTFNCEGNVNILDEFPILFFECYAIIDNKKKFLKALSIKIREKQNTFKLAVKGNLNLLNKKINFDNVLLDNKDYSKEDLKYFKRSFEKIIFEKSLMGIFDLKKIKNFVLDIS